MQVAPLTLGTMTFGAQTDAATARSMVDLCLERGVNFLDTANVYNTGRTEEILGEIIAGRRDRFLLASKVGIKLGDGPLESGLSPAAIRAAIEGSLRRLKRIISTATTSTHRITQRRWKSRSPPWTNWSAPARSASSPRRTMPRGS
jgi:aryl-alcohol dehydrogenase-like predicted oxidoreductase